MRRGRALAMVAVAGVLALASLVQPLRQADGMLWRVAGRPVDAIGHLQQQWQRLSRHCSKVTAWPAGSPRWREVQATLAAYSPPASAGATPVQVLGWTGEPVGTAGSPGPPGSSATEWLLAEVAWPQGPAARPGQPGALDPAIVPLRRDGAGLRVLAEGVWSGDSGPWLAPVFIRRFLAQRVPALPAALRQCLDPQLPPFAG